MKKLFVSVPMKGRKPEDIVKSIEKLHKMAAIAVGEELELIKSYNPDNAYSDRPIEALAESIKLMQDADYYICPEDLWPCHSRGCSVEHMVAREYDIQCIFGPLRPEFICPDAIEEEEEEDEEETVAPKRG